MRTAATILLILGLEINGCAHLGPRTIPQDRSDYSSAVGDSWKQQTLLNIVKLRYMDLPILLDVSQIVSGYAVDFVLGLTAESINGLRNRSTIAGQFRDAQPEFLRLLELLRDLQTDGVMGFQVDQDKASGKSVVIVLRKEDLAPGDAEKCE